MMDEAVMMAPDTTLILNYPQRIDTASQDGKFHY
jgi:hypothetical protein